MYAKLKLSIINTSIITHHYFSFTRKPYSYTNEPHISDAKNVPQETMYFAI